MARELHIVWAGRHRRRDWEELCQEYRSRIERAISIKDRPIRQGAGNDPGRQREESRKILRSLPDPSWMIALDGRGKQMSSRQFATHLQGIHDRWPHPIVFVLGSDLGLDAEVLEAAKSVLSLGPMTLGHELARLVLYEQIYRAISIHRGIKYHR